MKEKIFFLINSMEGGGAERVISIISSELSKDYDIDLITLKNINFFDLPNGVNYIPLSNVKNNFGMLLLLPFYILKFRRILKNNNYKSGISSLEISNFINILVNKKAIISFEISIKFFDKGFFGYIYKFLIKKLYNKSKFIKVNSEENKYDLAEFLKINLEKIKTIYNPIDFEKIEQCKKELVESDLKNKLIGKKVFITVARLVWQKNHKKIIESFAKVEDNNWIYLIVGDGEERKNLENQVIELGLQEKIIFVGAQKNVFKYLSISNYFIYASRIEGFPNVLGEAIACDLPIITSNFVSGAKECIIGNYDNSLKKIKYPYYGENGVLLDLDNYENEFIDVYKNLDKVKQNKTGLGKFKIEKLKISFENILFNT